MAEKTSDREIDLMEVLVKILDLVRSNLFLAVFLPVAGALVGWGFSHISENRSESQMMVVTEHLTEPQCEFLLAQLEKTDSFPDITEEQRQSLIFLKHKTIKEPIVHPLLSQSSVPHKTHIEITLHVKHIALRKVFENSIIRYLESSQPAIRKKEELEEFYKTMVIHIDEELSAMNELKKQMVTLNNTGDNAIDLYTKTIELTEKKIKYQQELKNIEAFQIVKGFDGMNKPKTASPGLYSFAGAGAGIALLAFLLFLKYFVDYYRDYHQNQPS
jgi:hypothetical protein